MAAALIFPFTVVVLAVRHYSEDEHLVARIQHASDKPVLVPADIEDDTTANMACRGEVGSDIGPTAPIDGPAAHVRVPRSQRPLGILAAGRLPKLNQSRLGNNPHHRLPSVIGLPINNSSQNTNFQGQSFVQYELFWP